MNSTGHSLYVRCFDVILRNTKKSLAIQTTHTRARTHAFEHRERVDYMWRVLRKLVKMLVRKLSSHISLCSPHRLIRDDNFRFYGIFRLNDVSSKRKYSLGGKCHPGLACADCTG